MRIVYSNGRRFAISDFVPSGRGDLNVPANTTIGLGFVNPYIRYTCVSHEHRMPQLPRRLRRPGQPPGRSADRSLRRVRPCLAGRPCRARPGRRRAARITPGKFRGTASTYAGRGWRSGGCRPACSTTPGPRTARCAADRRLGCLRAADDRHGDRGLCLAGGHCTRLAPGRPHPGHARGHCHDRAIRSTRDGGGPHRRRPTKPHRRWPTKPQCRRPAVTERRRPIIPAVRQAAACPARRD
jgi:hypothetical protein